MKKTVSKDKKGEVSPSRLIDARIRELSDWRGEALEGVRNDCGFDWLRFRLTFRRANAGADIRH